MRSLSDFVREMLKGDAIHLSVQDAQTSEVRVLRVDGSRSEPILCDVMMRDGGVILTFQESFYLASREQIEIKVRDHLGVERTALWP